MIEITMENGKTIRIELDAEAAPITVENFTKVKQGFYDGLTFHRIIPGFMIQGGCPEGTGAGRPGLWHRIKGEWPQTALKTLIRHTCGVISMPAARCPTRGQPPSSCMPTRCIWTAVTPLSAMWWKAWMLSMQIASVATISRDKPKRLL